MAANGGFSSTQWSSARNANTSANSSANTTVNPMAQQLSFILRNPELPKSKFAISSILRQYNEDKCRASTLARISYGVNKADTECDKECHSECDAEFAECDLEERVDCEVKLSQLPQQLLATILGDTRAVHDRHADQPMTSSSDRSEPTIKREPSHSDNCSDVDNDKSGELNRELNELIREKEEMEANEKALSNHLCSVESELKANVIALRECIDKCEHLKSLLDVIGAKQSRIVHKKTELQQKIDEINVNLIKNKGAKTDLPYNRSPKTIDRNTKSSVKSNIPIHRTEGNYIKKEKRKKYDKYRNNLMFDTNKSYAKHY